jgi:hypothetical protein
MSRPVIVIGETPWTAKIPVLGMDEVRAYSWRIRTAWQTFIDLDMTPVSTKLDTVEKKSLFAKVSADIDAFRVYRETAIDAPSGTLENPLGMGSWSPGLIWEALIQFENIYKTDRALWTKTFGAPVSKDNGPLENEGGIKQPSLLPSAAAVSGGLIAIGVLAVGGAIAYGMIVSKK